MNKSKTPVSTTAGIQAEIEQQGGLLAGVRGADAAAAVLCVLAQWLSRGEARELLEPCPSTRAPGTVASAGRHLITTNSCGASRHTWMLAGPGPRKSPTLCSRLCGGRDRSKNDRMSPANCRGT
jgi:hypothetical protein